MAGRELHSKPQDFNAYVAGNRVFNGGSSAPTMGPVDPTGYRERDLKIKARRNAILRRMKSNSKGHFMNKDWLGGKHA